MGIGGGFPPRSMSDAVKIMTVVGFIYIFQTDDLIFVLSLPRDEIWDLSPVGSPDSQRVDGHSIVPWLYPG